MYREGESVCNIILNHHIIRNYEKKNELIFYSKTIKKSLQKNKSFENHQDLNWAAWGKNTFFRPNSNTTWNMPK